MIAMNGLEFVTNNEFVYNQRFIYASSIRAKLAVLMSGKDGILLRYINELTIKKLKKQGDKKKRRRGRK